MESPSLGKVIVAIGVAISLIGATIWVWPKSWPVLFKLPLDLSYQKGNFQFFFPLGSSIVVSVILTAVFWIVAKWLNK